MLRRGVRMLAGLILLLALVLAGLWVFGPRASLGPVRTIDAGAIAADPQAWVTRRETGVPGLRPAARARIVWAGEAGNRTDLSVVYLHGYSASAEEIRPVPDDVAAALGANLFFARLSGHGRDGAAMAEPGAGDWLADLAEALAVGRVIGKRVIVIGTSTGGTLAALGALDPDLSRDLAGVALISPNFAVANRSARMALWPLSRYWMPLVAGAERSWEPANAAQAAHWTNRYPMVSIISLVVLVDHLQRQDLARATVPALFVFSDADTVVQPAATRAAAAHWGGPVTLAPVRPVPGSDPSGHVIAGDILSPGMTRPVERLILDWVAGL